MSENPVHHNSLKHIDVRYHFIRDCVTSGKLNLEKISMIDNISDGMTKCIASYLFQSLRHKMGLRGNKFD